jgi:hypothetical protein
MNTQSLVLYLLIVGCEVAFWLVLLLSLAARYLLHREALSRWLIRSLPVVDVMLLVFTAIDLRAGTIATTAHGLAAVYVGFTVAFGAVAVRWSDAHFAYRFASGAAPTKSPTTGWKAVRFELRLWSRCIAAWAIAFALIEALIVYVGNDAITRPLHTWNMVGLACVFFWFIFGPAWSLALCRREEPR